MGLRRSLLADLALLLLAVVVVVATAFVALRDVGTTPATDALVPAPSAPAAAPSAAAAGAVQALFIGAELVSPGAAGDLGSVVGPQLGWQVTTNGVPGSGYVGGPADQSYVERVPRLLQGQRPDVVVLSSGQADGEAVDGRRFGGNVQFVVAAVRTAAPDAEVVLVGPVAASPDAFAGQREILMQVAARYGVVFVDPIGSGYLRDVPDALGPDGLPTQAGYAELGRRLAADLRRVLPVRLVPGTSS